MSIQIQGFEELSDELDRLSNRAESVHGSNEIPLDELFPDDFMVTYTEFETVAEFFESSPWTVETEEDFERIPEDDFDNYVDRHTGFSSWEAMLSAAAREWVSRQIGL